MAILFADDFNGYGSSSSYLLNGLWGTMPSGCNITTDPDPLATGKVLQITSNPFGCRRPFLKGSLSVIGVAFRLWMNALPGVSGTKILCAMQSADVTYRLLIAVDSVGKIYVANHRPDSGPLVSLGSTTAPVLTANAYHHIETKFTMAAGSAGAIEVRVDGIPVLSLTDIDSGAATAEQVLLANGEGAWTGYYKDLVVWDDSGTHNTDFLGTVSVIGMTPASDVSLNWTPSTGTTGWNLIDNSPPVDGTDYISAPYPVPSPSEFSLTNLPTNVTSVRAMITQVRARKADGGDGNIQASLVSSGSSTADGEDRPITTAFTYYEDVFEVDPATSDSWAPSAADAANFKINRTV